MESKKKGGGGGIAKGMIAPKLYIHVFNTVPWKIVAGKFNL
jgi:hypothetical protein